MRFDRAEAMRVITVVVLAALISAVTAVLPIFAAVGKIVYANIVPVILVSITLGPAGGALYAAAASFVLNNIGMGSGVLPYVLTFQIVEAAVIGAVWYGKPFSAARFAAFVLVGTFLLKPVSYLTFYLFNKQLLGGAGCLEYMAECLAGYLSHGWSGAMSVYASRILCGCLLRRLLGYIFDSKTEKGERTA